MAHDPLYQVENIVFERRVNHLALLLDLSPLLPDRLLKRAIWLARNADEAALRAFLVRALARRLPTKVEQIKLRREHPVRRGMLIREVSIPEGKQVKRLMTRLSEEQRHEILERLLEAVEKRKHKSASRQHKQQQQQQQQEGDVYRVQVGRRLDEFGDSGGGGSASFWRDISENLPRTAASSQPPKPSPAAASVITPTPPPEERTNIVNLGFAHRSAADKTLAPDEPLACGHAYYFWLNIGRAHKHAIGTPTPIDLNKLPEEAVLTVALFGFENELGITKNHDTGELKIQANGTVKVLRQPLSKNPLSADSPADYLENFLVFPVRVPKNEGVYRLRCNIYCAQVLVQSYVVSASARTTATAVNEACTKKLDYVLSQNLRASHLASLTAEPHRLSIMVNSNGDGSHNFRFFGADETERFKDDAQIDGDQLSGFLLQARRALHKVSWDNENEWDPDNKNLAYRYKSGAFDAKMLARDLAYLARAGWRIYAGFISHLTKTAAELETLMADPGLVQIALKLSPRAVLPAAIVYDYAWKPDVFAASFDTTPFELCPTFAAALDSACAGGPPLEECDCFKGGCALKAMIADIRKPGSGKTLQDLPPVICPSGFWGYRHSLGLPLTLDGTNKDIPPVISFKDQLQMIACVSTDPLFVERDTHLGRLKKLKNALKFELDNSYGAIVNRLKTTIPQLLYFYCHGGVRANTNLPYLEIGNSDRFGPDDLIGEGISWKEPHPLVFINGCHTTSLNPEITLDFVSSFVQQSGAAGVIGTEITIFEPLAVKFAEECFSRFVGAPPHNESMPLGRAVRGARLELLKQGNPLGLVYIPYAVGTLRLQESQQN
ncbi:MAG TPA: hypothetical protein VFZ22_18230 [Pyrinomonadaceae bacterium]|nr:hypothetical protein [Pyrinomonadaceae bacterium]